MRSDRRLAAHKWAGNFKAPDGHIWRACLRCGGVEYVKPGRRSSAILRTIPTGHHLAEAGCIPVGVDARAPANR